MAASQGGGVPFMTASPGVLSDGIRCMATSQGVLRGGAYQFLIIT